MTALTLATAISFTSVAEERPASEQRLHTVQINRLEDLKAYFRYDPERDIIVSGHRGGMIIAQGTPEDVAAMPQSHTGRFLAQLLAARAGRAAKSRRKKA